MIGSVLATVAALALVLVISLVTAGHSTGNGCVDVSIPYATGAQEFYGCGARARTICAAVGAPGGYTGAAGRAVTTECLKAGVAVGR